MISKNCQDFVKILMVLVFLFVFAKQYLQRVAEIQTPVKALQLPQLSKREELGKLMEKENFETMIEIGVRQGAFAFEILKQWSSFKRYYGIDPWKQQLNQIARTNVNDTLQEQNYATTKWMLNRFGDRITLIRNISSNCIGLFGNETIDFIYLDGRHDFCAVTEDLTLYYPILKCNGILAGHDYLFANDTKWSSASDPGLCENGQRIMKNGGGVKGAVIEFTKTRRINIMSTTEDYPSFYFRKTC